MAGPDFAVQNPRVHFPVTIASGASLSEAVDLKGHTLVGILMPGTWSTADLTLQASDDGSTFGNVYDDAGTEMEIAAEASIFIRLDPAKTAPFSHVKVRSGTSGTPANQGGDRVLTLVGMVL